MTIPTHSKTNIEISPGPTEYQRYREKLIGHYSSNPFFLCRDLRKLFKEIENEHDVGVHNEVLAEIETVIGSNLGNINSVLEKTAAEILNVGRAGIAKQAVDDAKKP